MKGVFCVEIRRLPNPKDQVEFETRLNEILEGTTIKVEGKDMYELFDFEVMISPLLDVPRLILKYRAMRKRDE